MFLVLGYSDNNQKNKSFERPNIIFFLVDDLGWKDLGAYGSTFHNTPHIDALAEQSMMFTNAYAATNVCSPTRASIMTGKYPARLHITDWVPGWQARRGPRAFEKFLVPEFRQHLPLEEQTIAEVLTQQGYRTAHIGKWHLGGEGYLPTDQGFEINIAGYAAGSPAFKDANGYFSPYNIKFLKNGPDGEYLTDRLTAEAVTFIQDNNDRPFFLYLSHYAVHMPLQAKQKLIAEYKAEADSLNPQHHITYAAMVQSVDESMGRIKNHLKMLNIADNTIIFFFSDNGGLVHSNPPPTSNAPLRAGKGSAYEGGVRVPMLVHWPGVTSKGSVSDTPVISNDFYPTIAAMAGVPVEQHQTPDGINLVPLIKDQYPPNREALYWHYPHYHPGGATPYSAIREGPYKLIEFFKDGRLELYNLNLDMGEQKNLAGQMPEKAEELHRQLLQWRQSVNAQMPKPNPAFKSSKVISK